MIHFIVGNLLESNAQALVNTVNTDGVMGKGIALQFKNQFPNNFKAYAKACKNGTIGIGNSFVYEEETLLNGSKLIINFPTKTSWRKPSEYEYITKGLANLIDIIKEYQIQSIAIPPLGAGNGGLDWNQVKTLLIDYLQDLECNIYIYEPNTAIKEILKKERVALTPARAMLLTMLYDLVKNGEFISEFSAEKIAYFLQKFGAKDEFKLEFKKHFYGPYSGKVKHVLYYLNGSYITGYSSKDKKPFDNLGIITEAEEEITAYLNLPKHRKYLEIVNKTKSFLSGFYSNFGLELLSTVDFIKETENIHDSQLIKDKIENWSDRKRTLFTTKPQFIDIALKNLNSI